MDISVYGSGYVGLVVAACLAEKGHKVICTDNDKQKIAKLQLGEIPIFEPGLEEIVLKSLQAGTLEFTEDPVRTTEHGLCHFITVGTPPGSDGRADLTAVMTVCDTISAHLKDYAIIINKSTVPIGTADLVRSRIQSGLNARNVQIPFDVASNPEFLKQGAAVNDFRYPDRIVLGVESTRAQAELQALYSPFCTSNEKCLIMDCRSAELVKYAANALLATKISFMNEMANISEKMGADIEKVRLGISLDQRIGPHFIQPGIGYGGSCFGKDIQALIHTAQDNQLPFDIIAAVEKVNQSQKYRLIEKILNIFGENLHDKTFAVWGLAFKPNTNDMRDAPSQTIIKELLKRRARIQVFDPKAMPDAQRILGNLSGLDYCADPNSALKNADALIILTEWSIFREADLAEIKQILRHPVIFDGRNLYDPLTLKALGMTYYGMGRGEKTERKLSKRDAKRKTETILYP